MPLFEFQEIFYYLESSKQTKIHIDHIILKILMSCRTHMSYPHRRAFCQCFRICCQREQICPYPVLDMILSIP
jgi:hypothetical protein